MIIFENNLPMEHTDFEYIDRHGVFELYEGDSISIIDARDLYEWAMKTGRADYTEDYYDANESDRHGQRSGMHTFEQYIELPRATLLKDLIDYIKK